jgi:hypothetical protein
MNPSINYENKADNSGKPPGGGAEKVGIAACRKRKVE